MAFVVKALAARRHVQIKDCPTSSIIIVGSVFPSSSPSCLLVMDRPSEEPGTILHVDLLTSCQLENKFQNPSRRVECRSRL